MGQENVQLLAFNRGRISQFGLSRIDIERIRLSAETMTNFVPRVLGSMMLRPGLQYIGATRSNAAARFLPFVFSTDDTALLELTDLNLRVWISDTLLTRPTVTAAVTNGTFDTNLTGWTDSDESGGTSAWVTGGYLGLTGNGTAAAIRDQQVTVNEASTEHALRVVIQRGPVQCSIGSTAGGGEYLDDLKLETGTHSLAFTPTGNFHIRFMSRLKRQVQVDSCTVEAAGVVSVTTPWPAASLDDVRHDQSGDIVYVAAEGYQQRIIERYNSRSFGVARYAPEDGPYRIDNVSATTITPSALTGNVTLTASTPIFKSTNVGSLYRITSEGQSVTQSAAAADTFTNAIRIIGVGSSRAFTIVLTGTWVATVTLQRSLTADSGPWEDVPTASWTANTVETYTDGLDNQIVWYRLGVKTGDYTSGTVTMQLSYALGNVDGVARITAFTSTTSVSAEVITDLGGTAATDNWAEGEWSDRRGWPTSVGLYDGRLWWAGKNGVSGSISDVFDSFNPDFPGDAGPISRTIGSGPVDTINWILPLQRLILGAEGAEFSGRSNNFDEPLTPSSFHLKATSTQGSADVEAMEVDASGVFVQRGGTRLFELSFDGERLDYSSVDLTYFFPEAGQPRIERLAVQRQPDTRIHCIRSDGTVGMVVFDKLESVLCWLDIETDGDVEDAVVLPGDDGDEEDQVYYVVKRTINGATVRYLEKWALESQCRGAQLNRQADSFVIHDGSSTSTVTLSHLIGEEVVVWANGADVGTKTVSAAGTITLDEPATKIVAGLTYRARWKSVKLAYAAQRGTALLQKKQIKHLGVILADTHYQGLKYGASFSDDMDELPLIKQGAETAADTVHSAYDEEPFEFPGRWDTDSRLCLEANAPRPCTILAAVISMETKEKA